MWWLVVLLLPVVSAATLSGTVYGPDLGVVEWAILTVEGDVEQVIVITNGSYSLELDAGSYRLFIESGELFEEASLSLPQDGSFIRDFILLPSLDVPNLPVIPEFSEPEALSDPPSRVLWPWIFGFLLACFAVAFVLMHTRRPVSFDDYERAVIEALITHEGRATQKQIRSRVPFSEAKASLVISDLAQRGVVRKFKQGRGNIVVLQDGEAKDEKNEGS
ncbi:MAG: helix-turn-helix transcriptional regulator [Candidatus Woesearchaeota archaeon]